MIFNIDLDLLLIIGIIVVPLTLFIAVTLYSATYWTRLYKKFPYPKNKVFTQQVFYFVYYFLIWKQNYQSNISVYLGITTEGIIIKAFFLFRLGRPPIFIPWRHIQSVSEGPWRPLTILSFKYVTVLLDTEQSFLIGGQAAIVLEEAFKKYHVVNTDTSHHLKAI